MKDMVESLDKILAIYDEQLKTKDLQLKALARNNDILVMMVEEAHDALSELNKITGTYHPMIIQGKADRKDIKECSNIVQRANRIWHRLVQLRNMYSKIYGSLLDNFDINIVEKDKIEC